MKKYLIIALLILFAACKSSKNSSNTEHLPDITGLTVPTRVFVSAELQDTLMSFLVSIDSIPNPYNAPTLYMIICERTHEDTTIMFTAHIGLIELVMLDNSIPDSLMFHIKGGCEVDSKIVIVYYDGFASLANIIYEEVLSLEFVKDRDFFKTYRGEREALNLSPLSEWKYKLVNNDRLQLLYKQKGRHERREKDCATSI